MPTKLKIFSNPQNILIVLLLIYFFTHLYKISDPPNGYHAWRESDTAAVAEAFYKETKNIFQPRIHHRQDKIGITGMEFPIYNYAVGLLYHIWGFQHYVPRMLTIIMSLLGRMEERSSTQHFIISLSLIILGALIKPTALAVGLPMAVYLLFFKYRGRFNAIFKPKYLLFLGISILLPLAWNFYARYLKSKYALDAFYLGGDQIGYWVNTNWGDFFKKVYRTWLFEVYLGIPVVVGLIVGIFSARRVGPPLKIFFSWILGCFLMFFVVSQHMSNHHDYYGLILIPPLMIVAAYYIESLWSSGKKILKVIFLVVVIGSAIYVWPRIDQRYGDFTEQDFFHTRQLINRYIPRDTRVTVEDASPSIELYRLDRMGWTFSPDASDDKIIAQMQAGARYAIFYNRDLSETFKKEIVILYSADGISICRLKGEN
jgi:hypothetical protein